MSRLHNRNPGFKVLHSSGDSAAGFSLVEVLVSVAIMGVLGAAVNSMYQKFGKAARSHESVENLGTEMTQLSTRLQSYWDDRTRPNAFGGFTAAKPGFVLLAEDGVTPCTTSCPVVQMAVSRPQGADTVVVKSFCAAPGPIPALGRLNALAYASVMTNYCVTCRAGQIPMVTISSRLVSEDNLRFPRNGVASPSDFKIEGVIGMSMCFDQQGTGPLGIDFRAFMLDPHTSGDALKTVQKTVSLTFDNFAAVKMDATH